MERLVRKSIERHEMRTRSDNTSPFVYARVAGFTYLATILLGIFSVNFVTSALIVTNNSAATANNILSHEILFRFGVAGEILMYTLVILLAFSLYVVLKTVNRNLALLALLWRTAEAIVGGSVTVFSGLFPLLLLHSEASFSPAQTQALVGLFLDVRHSGLDVVLIFIGMGGTLFCYLFYKSQYVPRILAMWGMLTYMTMLILSFVSMLTPDLSESIRMAFYAPGGLFEIVFGLWLLIKGINVEQWKKRFPADD